MSHFTVAVILETLENNALNKALAPFQENNMEDCPKEYLVFNEDEDCGVDKETGKRGYWENPNRKWDWWQVGGRWKELLRHKDGTRHDILQFKDLDTSPDKAVYDWAIRFWEVVVEQSELREGESEKDFFNFYKTEYYTNRYGTKEKYAEEQAKFGTFALLDIDGKWYEAGQMGWWACDDSTPESRVEYSASFDRILSESNPEHYIVIVDCHI